MVEKFELQAEIHQKNIFEEKNLVTDVIICRAFKPLPIIFDIATKNFKNFTIPCLQIAIMVTPKKIKKAIEKVTIIWLVQVKLQGNMPKRFPTKIKRKSVKIKEKYFMPSFPMLSPIIPEMNSQLLSTTDCFLDGIISKFLIPRYMNNDIKITVIVIANEEFVNDIS